MQAQDTINLGDLEVMQAVFGRFFATIFDATEMDNEQKASESLMEGSIDLLACFSQEYEGVIVPDHLQLEVLAKRLVDTLVPLELVDGDIAQEKDPNVVMLIVISTMAEEFLQLLAAVHEEEQTQEVFELRCDALKSKWIHYFLGEE